MAIGTSDQLWGQTKVSAAEAKEHEDLLAAKRVTDIPNNLQFRADYNGLTDGLPKYTGYAPKGLAEGANGWLLKEYTYDANRQCTKIIIGYGNWTNRSTATYT